MMRGVSTWAVAVRKPGPEGENGAGPAVGEIEVTSEPLVSWAKRHRLLRLPVIRGVVALAESLKIGFRALAISANAQLVEEDGEEPEPIGGFTWGLTIFFSLALAIGLFFVVPVGAHQPDQGPARLVVAVLARRGGPADGDLHRLHRRDQPPARPAPRVRVPRRRAQDDLLLTRPATGSCPARAETYSRLHPRCGTSFLLIVMVLAIFVFAPIGLPAWYWLVPRGSSASR